MNEVSDIMFIPPFQRAVLDALDQENPKEARKIREKLNKFRNIAANMPHYNDRIILEGTDEEVKAQLHYYTIGSNCHWYIGSFNARDWLHEPSFCFACLFGDKMNSEYGSIQLPYLFTQYPDVALDIDWSPETKFREVYKQYH